MVTRSAWIIDKTEAVGRAGMVTAMQPLAAEAGAEILSKGGTATGQTICFDGRTVLPRTITPAHFELLDASKRGGMYGWLATEDDATEISTRFLAEAISGLESVGHQLVRREDTLTATHIARPSGIVIDGDELRAGVHPYTPATGIGLS